MWVGDGLFVLWVIGLMCVLVVCDVSFDVVLGEIFGIVGLVGVGCMELLWLIFGVDCVDVGIVEVGMLLVFVCIYLFGDVVCYGISLFIEDCKDEGLMLSLFIVINIVLGNMLSVMSCGWL